MFIVLHGRSSLMIEQRIENNLEIHILDNILIKNFVCVCTDNT